MDTRQAIIRRDLLLGPYDPAFSNMILKASVVGSAKLDLTEYINTFKPQAHVIIILRMNGCTFRNLLFT